MSTLRYEQQWYELSNGSWILFHTDYATTGLLTVPLHSEVIYWDQFSNPKWKDRIDVVQHVDSPDQRC